MKIEVLAGFPYNNSKFDTFAECTLTLVRKFVEIHDTLKENDPKVIGYSEDQGVDIEDYRLFLIESMVYECKDVLPQYEIETQFGTGYASELIQKGYIFARLFIVKTIERCANIATYSTEERASAVHGLKWAIGNLIYGFYKALSLGVVITAVDKKEPLEMVSAMESWCANHGYSIYDIACEMREYSKRFVPLVDVSEDYSEIWEQLFKDLDEDLKDNLCTVASVMYPSEIIAISAGQLKVDDDFIDMLKVRQSDEDSLINSFPEAVAAVMQKIPANLAYTFSEIDSVLNYSQLTDIVDGKIVYDEKFVKSMKKLKSDKENMTSVFGG